MTATITLATVQAELQVWLDARTKAAKGQSVSIQGRSLTTQDLTEINNMIARLSRQERNLLLQQSSATGRRTFGSLGRFN
jgi:hypothetical protein